MENILCPYCKAYNFKEDEHVEEKKFYKKSCVKCGKDFIYSFVTHYDFDVRPKDKIDDKRGERFTCPTCNHDGISDDEDSRILFISQYYCRCCDKTFEFYRDHDGQLYQWEKKS